MTISWPLSRQQVLDASGRPILDVRATFFVATTTTPLAVYADAGRTQPLPSPVVPDAFGRFPRVYLAPGLYREVVSSVASGLLWSDDGLGVAVAATSDGSTTSPAAVDPLALHQTGDVKWRLDGGVYPGFVRMNGKTIGNKDSGATEFADASAKALFLYLWNTFLDDLAPVPGGRGSTAQGDFDAGRSITIPSMQGLVAAGLDDMGASAALRLQAATNLSLTPASNVAQVDSAANLAINMGVAGVGVAPGTTILDIQGTQITLSVPATGGGTVIGRFGPMDAQRPGAYGGSFEQTIRNRNLPAVMPGGTARVTFPPHKFADRQQLASASLTSASGAVPVANLQQGLIDGSTAPPDPTDNPVTITNTNGGVPLLAVQPTRVGTYYLKL